MNWKEIISSLIKYISKFKLTLLNLFLSLININKSLLLFYIKNVTFVIIRILFLFWRSVSSQLLFYGEYFGYSNFTICKLLIYLAKLGLYIGLLYAFFFAIKKYIFLIILLLLNKVSFQIDISNLQFGFIITTYNKWL